MSTYDETRDDAARKLDKANLYPSKNDKEALQQAHNIQENVVGLARNLKESGAEKAHVAADYVRDRVETLRSTSTDALGKVESRIKDKPGQSIAIAFAAGLLASFILGRRSN